ncbi:hypothetical protein [Chrysiogenes arsenatis]|uniref:hypothetical protein n=1 Tax=Chrysiogenes arsenatis TaxID=309797 RepID=UPI0003F98FAC|nr:hypothetical protein [Chrysiogenes arsenatis]
MKTLTLKIDDSVSNKFLWLLRQFSQNEVSIVEVGDFLSDDEYLRSFDGMVTSIEKARAEHVKNGVNLNQLDW